MTEPDWTKFYYAHPTPERFTKEVRAFAANGQLEGPPMTIFLALVMRANANRIDAWLSELGDLPAAAREALDMAVWLSDTPQGRAHLARGRAHPRLREPAPDPLAFPLNDPGVLDMMWLYYFATGDTRPVRRVISAFEYMSDFGAAARFKESAQTDADRASALRDGIFQAASWSLASLMKEHPPLQATCEVILEAPDLTPNERCGLALALQRVDPLRWDVVIDPVTSAVTISRRTV